MNYIGSKHSLLQFLETSILKIVGKKRGVFIDGFAGTGAVGKHFQSLKFSIVANDLQYYSSAINLGKFAQIEKTDILKIQKHIDELNDLEGVEGFFYKNYCPGGTQNQEFQRMYFSDENGKKADALRITLEKWKSDKKITQDQYWYLLYCITEAVDKVANTTSVYGAFLKKLKKTALKQIEVKMLDINFDDNLQYPAKVFTSRIEDIVEEIDADVLYLDPPYNQRQYAPNYHVLETLVKYDSPKLKGKTGLRDYSEQKSDFCSKKTVLSSLEYLIENTKAKYVFLSYNNEGLMSEDDIKNIFEKYGEYQLFSQEYNRYKADKTEARNHTASKVEEHLHCLIKK